MAAAKHAAKSGLAFRPWLGRAYTPTMIAAQGAGPETAVTGSEYLGNGELYFKHLRVTARTNLEWIRTEQLTPELEPTGLLCR